MKMLKLLTQVESLIDKIPHPELQNHVRDVAINLTIPFNRWLGFHIKEFSQERVVVVSPPRTLRQNHVGGAHACALALLGEYPAGLLVSQKFRPDQFRFIITSLNIEYFKQGRGVLTGIAEAPETWTEDLSDPQYRLPMTTRIYNAKDELVAECKTQWQIKEWSTISP